MNNDKTQDRASEKPRKNGLGYIKVTLPEEEHREGPALPPVVPSLETWNTWRG
jgi:hypothetical protein